MVGEKVDKLIKILENRAKGTSLNLLDSGIYNDMEELLADVLRLAKHWQATHQDKTDDELALDQLNQLIEEALEMWSKSNKVQYLSEIRKLLNDRRAWTKNEQITTKQVPQQIQIAFLPYANQQFANDEKEACLDKTPNNEENR